MTAQRDRDLSRSQRAVLETLRAIGAACDAAAITKFVPLTEQQIARDLLELEEMGFVHGVLGDDASSSPMLRFVAGDFGVAPAVGRDTP